MTPYPRIQSLGIDPVRFSVMLEEFRAYTETEEKKVDYEEMEQESRLFPWIDDASEEYTYDDDSWVEDEDDGQPSEYDEWQDYMGGDDQDFGQYDNGEW